MYNKKVFVPNELQIRQIKELLESPSWVALNEWANYEYNEWCRYWMSLIPMLDLMSPEDKATLEKEYHAIVAVSEWLERVKTVWIEYIGDSVSSD